MRQSKLLLALVALIVISGCAHRAAPVRQGIDFSSEGKNYTLIDGIVYELSGGRSRFVMDYYDPAFFSKNYVEQNRTFFQRQQSTGHLFSVVREFSDGFEGARSVEELISVDRWHGYGADPSKQGEQYNYYDLGSRASLFHDVVHSGNSSMRFTVEARDVVTKSNIFRELMFYRKGDDVYFSFSILIENVSAIESITVFDLESSWLAEQPGMRLIFRNEAIAYELKSFVKKDYLQSEPIVFPMGRWVDVRGHLLLSDKDDGRVELWQDGQKVIDAHGQTLPLADTVYDSLETGITALAAGSHFNKTVSIDDVSISDRPTG